MTRRVLVAIGAVCLALIASVTPAAAQSISGSVVREGDNLMLSGIGVTVYTGTGGFVTSTSTDPMGSFSVAVAPGTYYVVTTNNAGYINRTYSTTNTFGLECGACAPAFSGGPIAGQSPVTVPSSGPTSPASIAFKLKQGPTIAGTVRRTDTNALVSGVSLFLYNTSGTFITSYFTDSGPTIGQYGNTTSFIGPGLPDGTYHLKTSNSAGLIDEIYNNVTCVFGSCPVSAGSGFTISGSSVGSLDFSLAVGAQLNGTVTGPSGAIAFPTVQIYNSAGNQAGFASTDGAGGYTTSGLPTGTYFVKASGGGFVPKLHSGINCVNCPVTAGTALNLVAGAAATTVNFTLQAGGAITGTITNSTPAPVSGSFVQLYDAAGTFVTSTSSNGSGVYTLSGLLTGNYFVKANPPGAAGSSPLVARLYNGFDCPNCDVTTGTPVSVTLGSTTSSINLQMTTGGTLSGTVTGPSGNVAGLQMSVLNSAGSTVTTVTTNGSGVYTFNGLLTGTYYVRTSTTPPAGLIPEIFKGPGNHETCFGCSYLAGSPISVTNGNTSTADFSLLAGGTISGTVTNSSTSLAVQNVSVSLVNTLGFTLQTKQSSPTGLFDFTGLPSGTYFLRTSNTLGLIDEVFSNINCLGCSATGGTPIVLAAPGTVSGRNFALAPGGRISGVITDAITGFGVGGSGTTSVRVFNASGTQVTTGTTDTAGNFLTGGGLPTGNYFVASSNTLGYIDSLYDGIPCFGCSAVSGTPIAVTQGSTTPNVNLALTVGGRITGTITRASDGFPVPYASAQIYSATGTSLSFTSANSAGVYAFAGLPTGTYYVKTNANYLGFVDQLYPGIPCANCTVTTGSLISVTVGATTSSIDFVLQTGGTISGVVTDQDTAAPIPNVFVQAYNASNTFINSVSTAPDGSYIIKGLPTGAYYLTTSNSLNYINKVFASPPFECSSCVANTGLAVAVVVGTPTTGKNFQLRTGGRLTGRVTDTASPTANPLGGVQMTLYSSIGAFVASTTTDINGNYVFAGLASNSYLVRSSNSLGFIDQVYNGGGAVLECLSCTPTTGFQVGVTAGNTTPNINFALAAGGRISGIVTDDVGNPLQGITVQIYRGTGGSFVTSGLSSVTGAWTSNAGLPVGTYVARTSNSLGYIDELYDGVPCLGCNVISGAQLAIASPGATVTGVNFSLAVGGSISGVITGSATGTPIQGVFAQVYTSGGLFISSSSSNGAGRFVLRGLPAGQYFVRTSNNLGFIDRLYNGFVSIGSAVTGGTPITVVVGASTNGVDFTLDVGNRITGVVRSNESGNPPIGGVSVQIYSRTGVFVSSATTSPSGSYVVGGLPAGSYYARTFNSLGYVNMVFPSVPCQSCSVTTGTLIAVPDGGAGIADFTLPLGGTITGTISATGGVIVGAGQISVSVSTAQGLFFGSASVNASGVYAVTGLPTGDYVVRTTNSIGLIDQQYAGVICLACTASSGTRIAVTAGSTRSGIDFTLNPGSRISGTVRDVTTAATLSGVTVQIYSSSNALIGTTTTNNLGQYTTGVGLPPGTYFARIIAANGYIGGQYSGIECLNCAPNTGTPIPVVDGTPVTGIDFNLRLGGRVTGRVTDTSGAGLQGITVGVHLATGQSVSTGFTNFDGTYATQGLPDGTYYLRTSNGQGYINEVYNNVLCLRCVVSAGTGVSVTVGTTTPGIDFALSLGGRISGTITDAATSQPIPGVTVQVFDDTGVIVSSSNTNNLGAYLSTAGLTSGTYYVKAFNVLGYVNQVYPAVPCATCDPRTGTPISVTAGVTTPNINMALVAGGRITGTVTGTRIDPGTGTPVTGPLFDIDVAVYTSAGGFVAFATTGTDGRYVSGTGLPSGNYFLATFNQSGYINQLYKVDGAGVPVPTTCGTNCAITSGSPVAVILGATTSGKDFNLTQGGRIEGRVTRQSNGTPIASVPVFVYDSSGIQVTLGFTDGAGRYISDSGLPAGTYYAGTKNIIGLVDRVYSTLDCAGCEVTGGQPIPVTLGNTVSSIDMALGTGEVLSGRVTDAATGLGLNLALVQVHSVTGRLVTTARTNEAGEFTTLNAVPAGTYFLRTLNGLGYIDRIYDTDVCLACDVTRGTPIVVDGVGTTTGLNFALALGGRIAGTVTVSGTGLPVPGSKVRVFNSAGSLIAESFSNGLGQYTSPGLPPGNYFVRTYNASGVIDEIYNNVPCTPCTIAQGTAITVVTGGIRSGIDFALAAGGIVSGYIINMDTGAPIAGVTVAVYIAGTNTLVANTDATNASGYYQISLPVGAYDLEPNPVPGYRPFVPVSLRRSFARSTVNVDTGTETTGQGFALVQCAPVTVNPAALPLATRGQLYSANLSATGGVAPYTFSISDGSPNTGLSLNSAGLLAGAPVFAGTGNFTVAVSDANSCGGARVFALTACSFFLSTNSLSTTSSAGSGSVTLNALAPDCPWLVTTTDPWITVTSAASGTGGTTVTFSYAFNTTGAARSGTITIGGQVFTITQAGSTVSASFGVVDTPAQGAIGVSGSMAVTGWALDDVEVKQVKILRNAVAGEGATEVFIGDATFVDGARPDVAALNPSLPFKTRAGWGYLLLTNMLPNQGNGTFTLHMDAVDAEGNTTRLGSRTFTGDNANATRPFGAIDTPLQGGVISGTSYVNFGWALTPNPKTIPTDGSTITVFVDGAPAGNPTYNNFRSDIASLFPGLVNTSGAIGFKYFDTTAWTNGVHTIAWVVFDDAGQAEGIGSRYFTVNNVLASQRVAPKLALTLNSMRASAQASAAKAGPAVSAAVGFDRTQPALELQPDTFGNRFAAVSQLGRLELRFGQACGAVTVSQVVDGERQRQPIGSSVDGGTFSWMPGPAFLGTYQLEFTVPLCGGSAMKFPVTVAVTAGR